MDTVADFLTRIRNASASGHEKLDVPSSRLRVGIATVLKGEGFIRNFKVVRDGKQGMMRLYLKYSGRGAPVINELRRVSRPGRRVYVASDRVPVVRSGFGFAVLSTNQGVLSSKAAKEKNLGGEVLCTIW